MALLVATECSEQTNSERQINSFPCVVFGVDRKSPVTGGKVRLGSQEGRGRGQAEGHELKAAHSLRLRTVQEVFQD